MKKRVLFICITTTAILLISSIVSFAMSDNRYFNIGRLFENVKENQKEIAAMYRDIPIYLTSVERAVKINDLKHELAKDPDFTLKKAVDSLIMHRVLEDEAASIGLEVTAEETMAYISELRKNYAEHPEATEMIDEFCKGANISLEEYWENIEESMPGELLRGKLKQDFNAKYSVQHNTEGMGLTSEMSQARYAAYLEYCQELFEANKGNIKYLIDLG